MDTLTQDEKPNPTKTMHVFCAILNDPFIAQREVSNLLSTLNGDDARCLLGLLDDRLETLAALRDTVQRSLLKAPAN
jgi:hypothetical protein